MIDIIGGGPAGSYAAYLLSKKNEEVKVYESKKQIGLPVQCTGIITSAVNDIIKIDNSLVVNRIKKVRFYSPEGKLFDVPLKKPDLIIDRSKFDLWLSEKAQDAGANYNFKSKFKSIHKNKIKINSEEKKFDYLVGADGPNSLVAKKTNLNLNRKNIFGAQARIKIECDPNIVEVWLGYGEFAWNVPENDSCSRIGCMSKNNANEILQKLIRKRSSLSNVIEYQGGLVPVWQPKQKIQNKNVMLIGDAASQVKASTYGGLFYGLSAAREMSKDINNYERLCNKRFGKDLFANYLIRKTLNRFSIKDYNKLVNYIDTDRIKKILTNNDRDHATKLLSKALLLEPRLLLFGRKLII